MFEFTHTQEYFLQFHYGKIVVINATFITAVLVEWYTCIVYHFV